MTNFPPGSLPASQTIPSHQHSRHAVQGRSGFAAFLSCKLSISCQEKARIPRYVGGNRCLQAQYEW